MITDVRAAVNLPTVRLDESEGAHSDENGVKLVYVLFVYFIARLKLRGIWGVIRVLSAH